jgi:hypothetical protein
MYTIVDSTTGNVLFAKFDNEVMEGQIAINKICTLETESEIFFNFETQQFYTK